MKAGSLKCEVNLVGLRYDWPITILIPQTPDQTSPRTDSSTPTTNMPTECLSGVSWPADPSNIVFTWLG